MNLKSSNIIILFALIFIILGASCSQREGVNGTITGLSNDSLLVWADVLSDEYQFERERNDTIILNDGKFSYNPQTKGLTQLSIMPFENIDRYPGGVISPAVGGTMKLLYSPGDLIKVDAVNEDRVLAFNAKGNRYSEQLSELNNNLLDAYKQRKDAMKVLSDRSFSGDKTPYQGQLKEAMKQLNDNELTFICENSEEPISAYIVGSWFSVYSDKILQYSDSLGAGSKNSDFGRMLKKKIDNIHKSKILNEEKEKKVLLKKEMIGRAAPEITLNDINGNAFSLSSLRGKYVVLDFWESTCSWCLASFPDLKRYYSEHPDEFEIVGIAYSDEMKRWRQAVLEKPGLPWINLFDDENLHDQYYVTASPTYVLMDKMGVIVDFPQNHIEVIKQLNDLREKGELKRSR